MRYQRFIATLLIASTTFAGLPATSWAALVGTEAAMTTSATLAQRERLRSYLARDEVRDALRGQGLAADEAIARVDALSDDEVQQLAGRLDSAPAGSGVIGTLFAVFVILLVTDILGFTKIFPFTRSVR